MKPVLLLALLLTLTASAFEFTGKVVGVTDGDTITVLAEGNKPYKVRLQHIDCPETRQPFATKAKQEAKRQKVNHFKEVAAEIVDAAREDSPDPVKAGLEAQKQAKVKEAEKRPLSPEEAREKRLQEDWASDWTPRLEAMKEQAEQEEMNREMELRRGFWTG